MSSTTPSIESTASPPELLIAGTGGFARETAEAVRALNADKPSWSLLGFLDDDPDKHGETVIGFPVLGPIDLIHAYPSAALTIATGRPDNYVSRLLIANRLELSDDRYATIVHPEAVVGQTCRVGPGSVLLAHTDLTADVSLGRHVAVMPQVVIPHDTSVGDFATLAAGVRLGGACEVAEGAYIGSGACLRQDIAIGRWAMVGMGAVVTRDVPPERLWQGVPARDVGRAPIPDGGPPSVRQPETRDVGFVPG